MNCACPDCGSDQTQPFRIIYEAGTSTSVHNTSGVGFGAGGLGVGGATTTGASITTLAAKVAPPAKPTLGCFPLITAPICIGLGAFTMGDAGGGLGLLIWFGILFWSIARVAKQSNRVWKPQYAKWEKQWLCHRCGNSFELNKNETH